MGYQVGIGLDGRYKLLHSHHQFVEQSCLQGEYFVLCPEYLLFIFLQLLCDVALGLRQRLLSHPLCRHLVLVGIPHLEIVTEYVVVANFQRRDARLLSLAFLYLQQIVLAAVGDVAQFVERFAHAWLHDSAFLHQLWRVVHHLSGDAFAQAFAQVHLLADAFQHRVVGSHAGGLHLFERLQRHFQRHHFARRHAARCHSADDSFQVADPLKLHVDELAELRFAEEVVDHVESLLHLVDVLQREYHPPSELSGAHRRHRAVYHIEQ